MIYRKEKLLSNEKKGKLKRQKDKLEGCLKNVEREGKRYKC